jgi:hypothetical protein
MSSLNKWVFLMVGAIGVAAVVGIVAMSGRPGGGGAQPGGATATAAAPESAVEPALVADLPPTARIPLGVQKVAAWTARSPVQALGWSMEFPWPPLAPSAPARDGARFVSETGVVMYVTALLRPVDWEQQYGEYAEEARTWLQELEKKSIYSFYEAVFSITGQAAANLSRDRLRLALTIKDALCPTGTSAINAWAVNGLRGFQLGDAAAKRLAIYVVPDDGAGVVINLSTRAEGSFSQLDVEHILGSIKRPTKIDRR